MAYYMVKLVNGPYMLEKNVSLIFENKRAHIGS